MKISAPTLTPLLRSDTQGLMLAALYLDSMREFTLSELALVSKTSVASVMRDVDRLVEAEYLLERRVGRSRLVHVNDDHRLTRSVKSLFYTVTVPRWLSTELLKASPESQKCIYLGHGLEG